MIRGTVEVNGRHKHRCEHLGERTQSAESPGDVCGTGYEL